MIIGRSACLRFSAIGWFPAVISLITKFNFGQKSKLWSKQKMANFDQTNMKQGQKMQNLIKNYFNILIKKYVKILVKRMSTFWSKNSKLGQKIFKNFGQKYVKILVDRFLKKFVKILVKKNF